MKLSFHGAKYEFQPSELEVTEGGIGGTYRGSPWKVHHFKQQHRHRKFPLELTYRGVHYKG